MNRQLSRLALLVALAVAATGCMPFESLWKKKPRAVEQPVAAVPAALELPLAEATHRFIVPDDEDVIGRLQVTLSRKEDTFADIARRFNVGRKVFLEIGVRDQPAAKACDHRCLAGHAAISSTRASPGEGDAIACSVRDSARSRLPAASSLAVAAVAERRSNSDDCCSARSVASPRIARIRRTIGARSASSSTLSRRSTSPDDGRDNCSRWRSSN